MRKTLIVASLLFTSTSAFAGCVVDDPTGTPLNVRSEPNGKILGALHNGVLVEIQDSKEDDNGKTWVYVIPDEGKEGWIYRNYIHCGTRQ